MAKPKYSYQVNSPILDMLEAKREELGLSQAKFANDCLDGLTVDTYNNWVNNGLPVKISNKNRDNICRLLGISLDEFQELRG
jgi:transcriptional regulator with XRE-family HTH domain